MATVPGRCFFQGSRTADSMLISYTPTAGQAGKRRMLRAVDDGLSAGYGVTPVDHSVGAEDETGGSTDCGLADLAVVGVLPGFGPIGDAVVGRTKVTDEDEVRRCVLLIVGVSTEFGWYTVSTWDVIVSGWLVGWLAGVWRHPYVHHGMRHGHGKAWPNVLHHAWHATPRGTEFGGARMLRFVGHRLHWGQRSTKETDRQCRSRGTGRRKRGHSRRRYGECRRWVVRRG